METQRQTEDGAFAAAQGVTPEDFENLRQEIASSILYLHKVQSRFEQMQKSQKFNGRGAEEREGTWS